jgi:hypothetical protein
MSVGFIWHRIGAVVGFSGRGNNPSDSIKGGNFLGYHYYY